MNLKPVVYHLRGRFVPALEDQYGNLVAQQFPALDSEEQAQGHAVGMYLRWQDTPNSVGRYEVGAMLLQANQMVSDLARLGLKSACRAAEVLRGELEDALKGGSDDAVNRDE